MRRGGRDHEFGGDWTAKKLQVIARYLHSYTTALKNTDFQKAYIDAFAGTGYRVPTQREDTGATSQSLPFPDLAEPEPQGLLDGSARLALQTEPRFDRYIFIERNAERCQHLEHLKTEFPDLAGAIQIRQGEANAEIRGLCSKKWDRHRAVLFLDPYGMQVEWTTIQAIARTKAIDMWVLFPLGIGVNRLLTRSGDIPESWRQRLNLLLGTEDWYEEFYRVEPSPTLFDTDEKRVVKATMETIGRYFNDRLKGVFAGVAEEPGVLQNSARNPLYLLCFAVGNKRGKVPALRIANHLLRGLR